MRSYYQVFDWEVNKKALQKARILPILQLQDARCRKAPLMLPLNLEIPLKAINDKQQINLHYMRPDTQRKFCFI